MAGLSEYGAEQALIGILPNGTNVYIGLLTSLPTARDGTGLVEATGSGYVRKAWLAWTNVTDAGVTKRQNNGPVSLDALTGALAGIVGFGVWDAATSGNLLAYGPIRDAAGATTTKDLIATDEVRFLDTELKIGIDD